MKFEDININPGYPLQLQLAGTEGKTHRFPCQLFGCIPGKHLLVSIPRTRKGPLRLRTGQRLIVRMMVANGIVLFGATVESLSSTPFPVLYLDYPDKVNFKEVRGAIRVDVNLPVRAVNLTMLAEERSDGLVGDISTTGARLELKAPIGSVGDYIEISGDVSVGPIIRPLCVKAVIRSRIERSTREIEEGRPAVYGVEFTESDEDKLLVLYSYVYSEVALGPTRSAEK